MAEPPLPDDPRDESLGLAGFLEEDVEWQRLMTRGDQSIARRELSGQAVELGAQGFTGVVLEYLKAIFELFGGTGGGRRAD